MPPLPCPPAKSEAGRPLLPAPVRHAQVISLSHRSPTLPPVSTIGDCHAETLPQTVLNHHCQLPGRDSAPFTKHLPQRMSLLIPLSRQRSTSRIGKQPLELGPIPVPVTNELLAQPHEQRRAPLVLSYLFDYANLDE